MKTVDWAAFAALPAGTVFCFCYQDRQTPMGHLCVKRDTLFKNEEGAMTPVDFQFYTLGPCVVDGVPQIVSPVQMYSESFRNNTGSVRVRRYAVLGIAEVSLIADVLIKAPNPAEL